MKALKHITILLVISGIFVPAYAKVGIANGGTNGRLGDNLKCYVHARWLSFINGWDFYYNEFDLSNTLALHTMHPLRYSLHDKTNIIEIEKSVREIPSSLPDDSLIHPKNTLLHNAIDYDNEAFMKLLRDEISPIIPIQTLELPQDKMTVALHVRRGGGWDRPLLQEDTLTTIEGWEPSDRYDILHVDTEYPERFAPDSYFIQQLNYILKIYPDTEFYVHIFTDDPSPHLIAKKYSEVIQSPRLTFGYRTTENRHDTNVLDDFFAMGTFDILIRTSSGFSQMAGRIGRPKLEIYPRTNKYRWEGKKLVITEANVIERDTKEMWTSKEYYLNTDTTDSLRSKEIAPAPIQPSTPSIHQHKKMPYIYVMATHVMYISPWSFTVESTSEGKDEREESAYTIHYAASEFRYFQQVVSNNTLANDTSYEA